MGMGVGARALMVAIAASAVALAPSATAGSDDPVECDTEDGLIRVAPDFFNNRALTKVGLRESDRAIGVTVLSDREGGSEVCSGAETWDRLLFSGGPGSDVVRLDGQGVIDVGQPAPREPFGVLPAEIEVWATAGGAEDELRGHPGRDHLSGGDGSDRLVGGRGRDDLRGGPSADEILGGPGPDTIQSTSGSYVADPRPAGRDDVDCGGGIDTAIVDKRDEVAHCERVRTR